MIIENKEYIAWSLVIPIPKYDFTSLDMNESMQTFIQYLESRIGDYWQPLYNVTNKNVIHNSFFNDDIKDDNVDLPYGDKLIDVKVEEISDSYLDALDEYIGYYIVIECRYAFHVTGKIKKSKRDASGNTKE